MDKLESSIGVNLRVTAHSNQGGRKYMEDMFCVAYQPTADERDLMYAYFGIFDGHGGREAALYAKTHLMDNIVSQKNFWEDDDELILKAIRDGFISTHYAMWREHEKWPKTPSGLPSTSGTTASIAFVRRSKLYIGHVGDSAIVLGYQDPTSGYWRAKPLTRDHKPESVIENTRITKSGGKVINKSGVPRVVWNRPRVGHKGPIRRSTPIDEIPFLAVARSLGDLWSYNSSQDEFVVSPIPDVSVEEIDVSSYRCLILGSDGLWNMLNAQEAVNSVYFAEKNNERQLLASPPDVASSQVKNWINPSKRLVDRALDRWYHHNLRADNTSVVTVVIDPPGPPKAQVLRQNQKNHQSFRQSVSSVTDPNTSKTVPAMVLASSTPKFVQPQPGVAKVPVPLSSRVVHPIAQPSTDPATPMVPDDTNMPGSSVGKVNSKPRKCVKVYINTKSGTSSTTVHTLKSSTSQSCQVTSQTETNKRTAKKRKPESPATRQPEPIPTSSAQSQGPSSQGTGGTQETRGNSRSDIADVQIHEISSSSEPEPLQTLTRSHRRAVLSRESTQMRDAQYTPRTTRFAASNTSRTCEPIKKKSRLAARAESQTRKSNTNETIEHCDDGYASLPSTSQLVTDTTKGKTQKPVQPKKKTNWIRSLRPTIQKRRFSSKSGKSNNKRNLRSNTGKSASSTTKPAKLKTTKESNPTRVTRSMSTPTPK